MRPTSSAISGRACRGSLTKGIAWKPSKPSFLMETSPSLPSSFSFRRSARSSTVSSASASARRASGSWRSPPSAALHRERDLLPRPRVTGRRGEAAQLERMALVLGLREDAAAGADRRGFQRRRDERHHDAGGHRGRLPHPPVLDGVHEAGRGLLPVLRVPEPVLLCHARPHHGGQPRRALRRLGGRGHVQLPAHRLLVHGGQERERRQEGLHREPHRRFRPPRRHLDARLLRRHAALHGHRGGRAEPDDAGEDLAHRQHVSRDAAGLGRRVPHPEAAGDGLRLHAGRACPLPRCAGKSAQIPLYVWLPDAWRARRRSPP